MDTSRLLYRSICIISFIGPFLSTALNVALSQIAADFSVPVDSVSWIITAYLIGTAAVLLPVGKYADIHGRRRVYEKALIVYGLSTLGAALAPGLYPLLALRLVQGLALAAVYVTYMPLLLTTTDENHQGQTLGAAVSLTYLGLTAGPVLGGILTTYLSWRCVFLLAAFLASVSWLYVRPVRDEWFGPPVPYVNAVSSALSIGGIGLFLYGFSALVLTPWPVCAGLILLTLFVIHERYSYHPLLPLFLFRNVSFAFSTLAALIQYSATYAISFLLALYVQLILGLTPAETGLLLLTQPLVMALLSHRAGIWADRFGTRPFVAGGLVFTAAGLFGFAFLPLTSVPVIVLLLGVTGFGSALFGAPNNKAIMSSVSDVFQGTASSLLALVRHMGQAVSMGVVTVVFARVGLVLTDYAAIVQQAVPVSFTLLGLACLLALAASLKE